MDLHWRIARDTSSGLNLNRQLDDVLARIRSPKIAQVLRYWHGLRGGREFPARVDVDPAEIKSTLPHIMITGVTTSRSACSTAWSGPRSRIWPGSTSPTASRTAGLRRRRAGLDLILPRRHRCPEAGLRIDRLGRRESCIALGRIAICPLSSDGRTIDRCLAIEDYEPIGALDIEAPPPVWDPAACRSRRHPSSRRCFCWRAAQFERGNAVTAETHKRRINIEKCAIYARNYLFRPIKLKSL